MWLVGATVVDGSGRDPRSDQSVLVEDGRIAGLGGTPPAGAEVLDCTGLTLTPGLIDAHVHLGLSSNIDDSSRHVLSVADLAADIFANCAQTLDAGFTTVRDTGGIDGGLVGVAAAGKIPSPRILSCGPVQCQTGGHGYRAADWEPTGHWDHHAIPGLRTVSLLSDGPDEMLKNVRESFRRGASFLKTRLQKHQRLGSLIRLSKKAGTLQPWCPPGPVVIALAASASMVRNTMSDSRRFSRRMASLEVLPRALVRS